MDNFILATEKENTVNVDKQSKINSYELIALNTGEYILFEFGIIFVINFKYVQIGSLTRSKNGSNTQ